MPRLNKPNNLRTQINVKRTTRNKLVQLKIADESLNYVILRLIDIFESNIPKSPFKVSQNLMNFIYQIKFKYGLDENRILYRIVNYIKSKPEILEQLFGNHQNNVIKND